MHWLSVSRRVLTYQNDKCMLDLVVRFTFPVCIWSDPDPELYTQQKGVESDIAMEL